MDIWSLIRHVRTYVANMNGIYLLYTHIEILQRTFVFIYIFIYRHTNSHRIKYFFLCNCLCMYTFRRWGVPANTRYILAWSFISLNVVHKALSFVFFLLYLCVYIYIFNDLSLNSFFFNVKRLHLHSQAIIEVNK